MSLVPIIKSDDPYFNHEAAQRAAEMVMKMDDDEAYMFTHLVMGDVLEEDIEKNRRTLQRHLDYVVSKRIERVKKAMLTTVSKRASDDAVVYAEALEEIEKAWKNPYTTGAYQFDESDFRRDPGSGRFQTKVRVNESMRTPLTDKQARNLGIAGALDPKSKYHQLNPAQKARYQQEYMQVANFLNAVSQSGQLGEHDVQLHIKDRQGNSFWKPINGRPMIGQHWNPADGERVVGVSAVPNNLTLGGASFGLVNSLSHHKMSGGTVATINRGDKHFDGFADDWANDSNTGSKNSNDRLYNRVKTGSKFVSDVAPNGSKLQIAARFGEAVGQHGPQAERVIGPHARKMTYRYRGTEKTPDGEAVRQFNLRVERASKPDALSAEDNKRLRSRQERAINRYRDNKAANQGKPPESVTVTAAERSKIRSDIEARFMADRIQTGSGDPLGAGREYLASYLLHKDRAPKKDLYNLHLESGNTPASTGFIINSEGKIVTQAQGYGDDHYVPFNLKNLKGLRGGEYIRTRSVGGPTTEDIYTALASGARRLTVVSRSGYFTVEFNPETTQGRFNDKARRMTHRYGQILDTVQSEQVDRPQKVSPEVKAYWARQVDNEFPEATPRQKRAYTAKLIEEYKTDLQMTSDDQEEFNALMAEQGADLPEDARNKLHAQMMNDWQAHNEFKFKLNGLGYQDALQALHEQFPYYVEVKSGPLKELERIETEKDKGYVEPGRNRPTEARAGSFGTAVRLGDRGNAPRQTKFSASQADYQGWVKGAKTAATPAAQKPPEEGGAAAAAAPTTPTPTGGFPIDRVQAGAPKMPAGAGEPSGLAAARASAIAEQSRRAQRKEITNVQNAGVTLIPQLQQGLDWSRDADPTKNQPALDQAAGLRAASQVLPPLGMTNEQQIREYFGNPANVRKATDAVKALQLENGNIPKPIFDALKDYANASGALDRVDFDPKAAFVIPSHPYRFPGAPYETGADPTLAEHEAERLNGLTKPISDPGQNLSEMDEDDLRNEINVLMRLHQARDEYNKIPEDDLPQRRKLLDDLMIPRSTRVSWAMQGDNLEKQAEYVHRMRALNLNRGEQTQYNLPPTLARTVVEEPPTQQQIEDTKGLTRSTVELLENAAKKIQGDLDQFDEADHPRVKAAEHLRASAYRFKQLNKLAEIPIDRLKTEQAGSEQAIMMAHAAEAGTLTPEQIEDYVDRNDL